MIHGRATQFVVEFSIIHNVKNVFELKFSEQKKTKRSASTTKLYVLIKRSVLRLIRLFPKLSMRQPGYLSLDLLLCIQLLTPTVS